MKVILSLKIKNVMVSLPQIQEVAFQAIDRVGPRASASAGPLFFEQNGLLPPDPALIPCPRPRNVENTLP
jgi:hypothetical protein